MAAKTFVQLYTDALTQADETAGSGSSTAKTIIKAGINESYAEVAGIRDWKTLENSTTITGVAGTFEYTPVTASATVCRIRRLQSVLDESNNRYLNEMQREQFETQYPYVDTTSSNNRGAPRLWFQSGYTSSRDMKLKLFEVPDSAYTFRVFFYEEPLELSADADAPRIPDQFHYGLSYLRLAKYFEFQKDPMASYYRGLHTEFKQKILTIEYDPTDEMPQMFPNTPARSVIRGKLGRIYNT